MRIPLVLLVASLTLAGCSTQEPPAASEAPLGAQESSIPADVLEFEPVAPVPCERESSDAATPAERRAEDRSEVAWAPC